MINTLHLKEAIFNRTSIRTFDGNPLTSEHETIVKQYLDAIENRTGIFGSIIHVDYFTPKADEFKAVGTYGVIKNAPAYLVVSCKNTRLHMLDCGYVIENLILFLMTLGIGSCWLGGTFKRQQISISSDLESDEFIPILVPIGYENEKKSFTDRAIRTLAKSHGREPFNTRFYQDTVEQSIADEKMIDLLEHVRVAPSASNKQPWRIIVTRDFFEFYLERTPNYGGERLGYDIQLLDIGIALAHLNLACMSSQKFSVVENLKEISRNLNAEIKSGELNISLPSKDVKNQEKSLFEYVLSVKRT